MRGNSRSVSSIPVDMRIAQSATGTAPISSVYHFSELIGCSILPRLTFFSYRFYLCVSAGFSNFTTLADLPLTILPSVSTHPLPVYRFIEITSFISFPHSCWFFGPVGCAVFLFLPYPTLSF